MIVSILLPLSPVPNTTHITVGFFSFRDPSKTPTSKAFMGIKFYSMSQSSSDRLLHDYTHTQQKGITYIKEKKQKKNRNSNVCII